MKVPLQNKGNLAPPNPETIAEMKRIIFDLAQNDTGALFWTEDEGFLLKLPELEDNQSLPVPLYLLSLCFMRLNNDPDFPGELLEWSRRKPH